MSEQLNVAEAVDRLLEHIAHFFVLKVGSFTIDLGQVARDIRTLLDAHDKQSALYANAIGALDELEHALVSGLERGGPSVTLSVSDLLASVRALKARADVGGK